MELSITIITVMNCIVITETFAPIANINHLPKIILRVRLLKHSNNGIINGTDNRNKIFKIYKIEFEE